MASLSNGKSSPVTESNISIGSALSKLDAL